MRIRPHPRRGWPQCSPRRRGGGRSGPRTTSPAPRWAHGRSCNPAHGWASGLGAQGGRAGLWGGRQDPGTHSHCPPAAAAPVALSRLLPSPRGAGWRTGHQCWMHAGAIGCFGDHQEGPQELAPSGLCLGHQDPARAARLRPHLGDDREHRCPYPSGASTWDGGRESPCTMGTCPSWAGSRPGTAPARLQPPCWQDQAQHQAIRSHPIAGDGEGGAVAGRDAATFGVAKGPLPRGDAGTRPPRCGDGATASPPCTCHGVLPWELPAQPLPGRPRSLACSWGCVRNVSPEEGEEGEPGPFRCRSRH